MLMRFPKAEGGGNAVNASHETDFFFIYFFTAKKYIPASADKIKSYLAAVSGEKQSSESSRDASVLTEVLLLAVLNWDHIPSVSHSKRAQS